MILPSLSTPEIEPLWDTQHRMERKRNPGPPQPALPSGSRSATLCQYCALLRNAQCAKKIFGTVGFVRPKTPGWFRLGSFCQDTVRLRLGSFCRDANRATRWLRSAKDTVRLRLGSFCQDTARFRLGSFCQDTVRLRLGSFCQDNRVTRWVRSAKTLGDLRWLRSANSGVGIPFRLLAPAYSRASRRRAGTRGRAQNCARVCRSTGACLTAQLWRMHLT